MSAARLPVLHARASAFSYRCHACSRCCYGKRIQVNPYELARLARNLGITTSEVIEKYTVDGGIALATRSDSACVFLGAAGCTVHADRPLVCRLYPLGRIVQPDGSEMFVENAPHPETEGVYGEDGTVGSYLDGQGVAPYIAAADRYYAVLARLMETKRAATASESGVGDARSALSDGVLPDVDARAFTDADLAVQLDAGRSEAPVLVLADALMDRHIAILERWTDSLTA